MPASSPNWRKPRCPLLGADDDAGLGGADGKGERLGEVELPVIGVVGQVATPASRSSLGKIIHSKCLSFASLSRRKGQTLI